MTVVVLALRDLGRRRLRSTLTATGIAVGVATLVLLGGLAERMAHLVGGGRDFASGQITVSGAGTGAVTGITRGGLVTGEQLDALRAVPGVASVAPIVLFPIGGEMPTMPFSLPGLVFGVDVETLFRNHENRNAPPPALREGRAIPRAASDEVVVGSQVALQLGAHVGGTIQVRDRTFTVIGLLEPTFTGPDSFVFMPFETAERLLVDTEPVLRKLILAPGTRVLPIATAAAVFWAADTDPEAVAAAIRAGVPNVTVLSPGEAARQIDRAMLVLTSLIVGAAVTALVVAALAVANTMFTSVLERRRAIGLLRAVGATRRQVVRQLLLEATLLGVAGTGLGLGAGSVVVTLLNHLTAHLGAASFLLTARLLAIAAVLPPVLAALGGLWPAWRAARLRPTEALRAL